MCICVYICIYTVAIQVGENNNKRTEKKSGKTQKKMQDMYGRVQGFGWCGGHGKGSNSRFDREMTYDLWNKFNNSNNNNKTKITLIIKISLVLPLVQKGEFLNMLWN